MNRMIGEMNLKKEMNGGEGVGGTTEGVIVVENMEESVMMAP